MLGNVINVLVFIVKGWLLVFVMMWVRWTLPRLRIDQVMMTCLKYLLPISCVLLLGVSLWQLTDAAAGRLDYLRLSPVWRPCVRGVRSCWIVWRSCRRRPARGCPVGRPA